MLDECTLYTNIALTYVYGVISNYYLFVIYPSNYLIFYHYIIFSTSIQASYLRALSS